MTSINSAPGTPALARPHHSVLLLAALLAGCAAKAPLPSATSAVEAPPPPVVLGADRDARGCIASAGYRWCERLHRCERPWELAAEKGLPNSPEAFADACGGSPPASVAPVAPPATAPDSAAAATDIADRAPAPPSGELPASPHPPTTATPSEAVGPAAPAAPVQAGAQR